MTEEVVDFGTAVSVIFQFLGWKDISCFLFGESNEFGQNAGTQRLNAVDKPLLLFPKFIFQLLKKCE